MTWLDDTEPFELRPHITRKRIMRGLTPERRKWKNATKLRRLVRLYTLMFNEPSPYIGIENGIPFYTDSNDNKRHFVWGWNRSYIDGKYPHWNGKMYQEASGRIGKSSRAWMRLVASWWQEVDNE